MSLRNGVNEYERYVRIPELLDLQHPRSSALEEEVRASELFFIVVHQSAEVLLRQVIDDLRAVAKTPGEWGAVEARLLRAVALVGLLRKHLDVLDHLPREHFLAFREQLGTASASGSSQFAEVFALLGVDGRPCVLRQALNGAGTAIPEHVTKALDALVLEAGGWQADHVALVKRMIGELLPGTAGTEGVAWLRSRILPPPDEAVPAQGLCVHARTA
ncbi:tryptophan 2,3-dioxygenase family protein [Streptomyces sp. NPDC050658]|uniref:tryptophan 2,3-dioxygenase family protein n=1 Tax=unclassified Streptomyces TaxID=2593676 RepID=UPI00343FB018